MRDKIQCPGCDAQLRVPEGANGRAGRCPHCKAKVSFPDRQQPQKRSAKPAANAKFRYDVFISYRHSKSDRKWAKWLHTALETYKVPDQLVADKKIPSKLNRVFRDEEELAAHSDLSPQIGEALRSSKFLIVICSPRTPESRWVAEEIRRFREMGRGHQILGLLIEGEPADSVPPLLYSPLEENGKRTAPPSSALATEPLLADVRPKPGDWHFERVRFAKLRLIATILDLRFDDLRQRDTERRFKQNLKFYGALSLTAILMVILAGALWISKQNEKLADQEKKLAQMEKLKADRDKKLAQIETLNAVQAEKSATREKLKTEEKLEEQVGQTAEEQKRADREEHKRKWRQYLQEMETIESDWLAGRYDKVRETLELQKPGAGESDFRGIEWYYWDFNLSHSAGFATFKNFDLGCSIALSPDQKILAVNNQVSLGLWELETGRQLNQWKLSDPGEPGLLGFDFLHESWDNAVAFSANGRYVAGVSRLGHGTENRPAGHVYVWEIDSGEQLLAIEDADGVNGRAVCFDPASRHVVASANPWAAWDLRSLREKRPDVNRRLSGEPIPRLSRPNDQLQRSSPFHFVPNIYFDDHDPPHLVTDLGQEWSWTSGDPLRPDLSSEQFRVYPFNQFTGILPGGLEPIIMHLDDSAGLSIYMESRGLAINSAPRVHTLWPSGVECFNSHKGEIVAACSDHRIRVWDETDELIDSSTPLEVSTSFEAHRSVLLSDDYIVAIGVDGSIERWKRNEDHSGIVTTGFIEVLDTESPLSPPIVPGSYDRDRELNIVINAKTQQTVAEVPGTATFFNPQGTALVAMELDTLHIYQIENFSSSRKTASLSLGGNLSGNFTELNRFTADGRKIVFSVENAGCVVADCVSGEIVARLTEPDVLSFCVSPSGMYVAIGTSNNEIAIFNTITTQEIARWQSDQNPVAIDAGDQFVIVQPRTPSARKTATLFTLDGSKRPITGIGRDVKYSNITRDGFRFVSHNQGQISVTSIDDGQLLISIPVDPKLSPEQAKRIVDELCQRY